MVVPSKLKFGQEDGPSLRCFFTKGGEDGFGQILFNGFSMFLVEVTRVVVGGALGTHVIAGTVHNI